MDLLADRATQGLGLRWLEPGKLLRDPHVLLLVDADPVRVARDRLEPLVDVRHRLAAVLPRRVARDVLHRPGSVQRDQRDHVLEHRRLHGTESITHPRRLELEHAGRVGTCEHLVGLAVVHRDLRDVEAVADERDGLVDHVEVSQPEEVDLEQSQRVDVLHRELRDDFGVGAFLLERDDLDQGLRTDHDARGMDRVRAREPFERPCQLQDLLRDRIGVDDLAQLCARRHRVLERLARALGNEFRDAVDDAVWDLENATRITERRAGGHRRERDDLREVDVHVGHVLAGGVQEPLEQEPVPHRVDIGDPERVGGERAGGRAATGTDRDAVALRERDEVGDDQEVVGKPHLTHGLELEPQTLVELGSGRAVLPHDPLFAELDEVVERLAAVGHGELRQVDAPELELDVAALRDLERSEHRVPVTGEVEGHLLRRLEVELVRPELPVVRILERVGGLDAEECLVRVGGGGVEVVDVTRRDEREAPLRCEPGQLVVDRLLDVETGVLQLDVGVVATEDLLEAVELGLGVAIATFRDRPRDTTGEATGECDHPRRVALEELPVDARLVVVALEISERAELDEVAVTGLVGGEQRQVRVPLVLLVAVVDGPRHRPVVGERDRRHLERGSLLRECRDPARSVEDRVLGMDVQVNERGTHGMRILLASPDGTGSCRSIRTRASSRCVRIVKRWRG